MIYSCRYHHDSKMGKFFSTVVFDLYSEFIALNYIHAVQVIAQHFQFYCRRQVAILKKKKKLIKKRERWKRLENLSAYTGTQQSNPEVLDNYSRASLQLFS